MAYQWQTVESAAVTLGVSARTLARRISDGKIESRLENGRREVLVCLPDPEENAAPDDWTEEQAVLVDSRDFVQENREGASDEAAPLEEAAGEAAANPLGSALVLARSRLAIAEDRIRNSELTVSAFRQAAEMAGREIRRAKLGALCAWGTVALLSAGVIAAVGYTTAKVSRSQCQSEYLQQRLTAVSGERDKALDSASILLQQAEDSRIAAANAQGRLDAMMQEQAKLATARIEGKSENGGGIKPLSPASQPTFLQRMASILDGPEK